MPPGATPDPHRPPGRTSVVVVGSANLDLVVGLARRPQPGETVAGDAYDEFPGGKGANQAIAAARVAPTAFVGARGADRAGDLLEAALRGSGVDVSFLGTVDRPTGRAFIQVTPDGENSIVVLAGANAALAADSVDDVLAGLRPAVVLTQLETPMAVTIGCHQWAVRSGARFVLNPSPVAAVPAEVLAAADPLILNSAEAAQLCGGITRTRPAEVARALGDQHRSVVLTAGADGAYVAAGDRVDHVPAGSTPVVADTTGACDSFAGTLAAELARGTGLHRAAVAAARAAARVIQTPRAHR